MKGGKRKKAVGRVIGNSVWHLDSPLHDVPEGCHDTATMDSKYGDCIHPPGRAAALGHNWFTLPAFFPHLSISPTGNTKN